MINLVIHGLASIGFVNAITFTIGNLVGMIISITSLVLFILALRLGKRVITLNLTSGHNIVLGIRKGVPVHLIQSIMKSIFRELLKFNEILIFHTSNSINNSRLRNDFNKRSKSLDIVGRFFRN